MRYDEAGAVSRRRSPDGEIGRHSGLKIVKVYAFTASKCQINKRLFEAIDDLNADATLTHFSWYSWRVWR